MGLVSTANLEEGMVLSSPVYLPSGRLILGGGISLTEKHVQMMKVWGISYADVSGFDSCDSEAMENSLEENIARADSMVSSYFPLKKEEEPIKTIYTLCCERCAQLIIKGDSVAIEETLDARRPEGIPSREKCPSIKPRLNNLIGSDVPLGSLPDIYFKIQEIVNSPVSSATSIARVVSKDPNLSLRLLRLVNSAFYSFPSPIKSIPRAIAIIGMRELSSLALAVSTMKAFRSIPSQYVDMKSFWKHSIACGVIARILAYHKKSRKEEYFFMAGLLHDVGRAILYCEEPEWMSYALDLSRFFRIPLVEVERRLLGYDHGEVTFKLLEKWNIPEPIRSLAAFHHDPGLCENPAEGALIWLADYMANAMKFGTSGTYYLPPVDHEIWDLTGMEEEELRLIFTQSERQIREILHIFLIL